MKRLKIMKIYNIKFKTNPIVFHRPGPGWHSDECNCSIKCRIWKNLIKKFFSERHNYKKPDDVTIVTWSNRKEKQILEKCLEHLNFEYLCLGKDITNWKNTQKFLTLHRYIKNINTDLVFGLDSFDVLFLGDINYAIKKFKNLNCEMLVNSSPKKYPEYSSSFIEDKIAPLESNFIYINAGCWIAKKEFLSHLLDELNSLIFKNPKEKSEQYFLRCLFNRGDNYKKIKIDYYMEIFQSGLWEEIGTKSLL